MDWPLVNLADTQKSVSGIIPLADFCTNILGKALHLSFHGFRANNLICKLGGTYTQNNRHIERFLQHGSNAKNDAFASIKNKAEELGKTIYDWHDEIIITGILKWKYCVQALILE
ncbi:MAG: hypothetical protein LUI60_05380 [Clostridia bacterium]|nr:hypothetical protein [Clostridia bacterium]